MASTRLMRPDFLVEEAQALVRELWNVRGSVREPPSERDQNFRVAAGSGADYVLKIAKERSSSSRSRPSGISLGPFPPAAGRRL
jgi:Ser/Thr protein kinase RdoA (MazF antagonist)